MESKRQKFFLDAIQEKENKLIDLAGEFYDLNIKGLFTGEVAEQINNCMTEMDLLTKKLLNYENPNTSNS